MQQELYRKGGLNGATLKWLAILAMIIDHIAAGLLLPYSQVTIYDFGSLYMLMRLIGRIAFPIFAFLMVQGYQHTSDVKKYLRNLMLFALVSEFPFDLTFYNRPFYWGHQNIFFTLLLGIIGLSFYEKYEREGQKFLQLFAFLIPAILAETFSVDYGFYGVIFIFGLGILRNNKVVQTLFGIIMGLGQGTASFAFLPIWFYNGQRGKQNKWFFYLFYPGHLLLIYFYRILFLSI